jgi:hypothetical protein
MYDSRAWALAPFDIGSVRAYYAELINLSREWLAKALELAPDDPRNRIMHVLREGRA